MIINIKKIVLCKEESNSIAIHPVTNVFAVMSYHRLARNYTTRCARRSIVSPVHHAMCAMRRRKHLANIMHVGQFVAVFSFFVRQSAAGVELGHSSQEASCREEVVYVCVMFGAN